MISSVETFLLRIHTDRTGLKAQCQEKHTHMIQHEFEACLCKNKNFDVILTQAQVNV